MKLLANHTELASLRAENARLTEQNRVLLQQAAAGQARPEKVIDSNAMGTGLQIPAPPKPPQGRLLKEGHQPPLPPLVKDRNV